MLDSLGTQAMTDFDPRTEATWAPPVAPMDMPMQILEAAPRVRELPAFLRFLMPREWA
ncbi:hypothetical protein CLV74_10488 [Donghicola tyrosinivorans]|uniref:Uncharacterized protein n=1 Tax=Donghicola tyrosinivorans TaxID=1652492 RepID=A0A2T0WWK4_9RHOB|nr:hypothetical protein CLV74_10488 [Donghicola tyrosinivorans]